MVSGARKKRAEIVRNAKEGFNRPTRNCLRLLFQPGAKYTAWTMWATPKGMPISAIPMSANQPPKARNPTKASTERIRKSRNNAASCTTYGINRWNVSDLASGCIGSFLTLDVEAPANQGSIQLETLSPVASHDLISTLLLGNARRPRSPTSINPGMDRITKVIPASGKNAGWV